MKTLKEILNNDALPKPFGHGFDSSSPTVRAQKNLEGKTHYVEPSTLSFFKSRILSALPVANGAFYKIIESTSIDYYHTKRGYRAVVFDLFGTTIYCPQLEHTYTSKAKADKAFYAWFEDFDPIAHYKQAIHNKLNQLEKEKRNLYQALQDMTEEVTA